MENFYKRRKWIRQQHKGEREEQKADNSELEIVGFHRHKTNYAGLRERPQLISSTHLLWGESFS